MKKEEYRYIGPTKEQCTSGCAVTSSQVSYFDKQTQTLLWTAFTQCGSFETCRRVNRANKPLEPPQSPGLISRRCVSASFCQEEWSTTNGGRVSIGISTHQVGVNGPSSRNQTFPPGWREAADALGKKSWKLTTIRTGPLTGKKTWVYR